MDKEQQQTMYEGKNKEMIVIHQEPPKKFKRSQVMQEIINYVNETHPEWRIFVEIPYCDFMLMRKVVKMVSETYGTPWTQSDHKKQTTFQLAAAFKVAPVSSVIDPLHNQFWSDTGVGMYIVSSLRDFKYDLEDLVKEYEI